MNNEKIFLKAIWKHQNQSTLFHFFYYAVCYEILSIDEMIELINQDDTWKKKKYEFDIVFEKIFPDYIKNVGYSTVIRIGEVGGVRTINFITNDSFSTLAQLKKQYNLEFQKVDDPRDESLFFQAASDNNNNNCGLIFKSVLGRYTKVDKLPEEATTEISEIRMITR